MIPPQLLYLKYASQSFWPVCLKHHNNYFIRVKFTLSEQKMHNYGLLFK